MNKYLPIINLINEGVNEFNSYITEGYKISTLDPSKISDDSYFLSVKNKKWDDYRLPRNCGVGGVYFYFGVDKNDTSKICIYIGKASFSRTTGQRLWTHFRNRDQMEIDGINYYTKYDYLIELITLIPIENQDIVFLAPALEEFLISKFCNENIPLFNDIGT